MSPDGEIEAATAFKQANEVPPGTYDSARPGDAAAAASAGKP